MDGRVDGPVAVMATPVFRCPHCKAPNPSAEALAVHLRRLHDIEDEVAVEAEVWGEKAVGTGDADRRRQNVGLARGHAATLELVATVVLVAGLILAAILGLADDTHPAAAICVGLGAMVAWGLLRASAAQLHLAADVAERDRPV